MSTNETLVVAYSSVFSVVYLVVPWWDIAAHWRPVHQVLRVYLLENVAHTLSIVLTVVFTLS